MKPFDNILFPWTIALLASGFGSIGTAIGLERPLKELASNPRMSSLLCICRLKKL
jgi:hypothetical protein